MEKTPSEIAKELSTKFDKDGNCQELGDPYRETTETCKLIFDSNGDVRPCSYQWIESFVLANRENIHPLCDAVKILMADDFAGNTKGNYSAIYMWR